MAGFTAPPTVNNSSAIDAAVTTEGTTNRLVRPLPGLDRSVVVVIVVVPVVVYFVLVPVVLIPVVPSKSSET